MGANRASRRAMLALFACIAALSQSCSRPASRTAPQGSAQAQSRAAQPGSSAAQTRAVIVAAPQQPEPSQQAQNAAGQPPDRILAGGHSAAVTAVAFSPDRQRAATAGDDKTVRIWELATAGQQRVLTGYSGRIAALAFSPDGARLASAGDDGVRVWDAASGAQVYAFTLSSKFAQQVAFSADGQLLAASAGADDEGGNSFIEVHNAATGARINGITLDWNNAEPIVITGDGRLLSSGGAGEDGEYVSTKIWDLRTARELKALQVLFSAISPDGRWGASLEFRQGTQINLWDIAAGRRVRTIAISGFQASRVIFAPDGARILVAGQNDAGVKSFDVATGRELQSLPISAAGGVMGFSSDGKSLAAASGNSVDIWDLAAGHELETLAGQLLADDLAFTPDGKLLITGGAELGVWDIASGKLLRTVEGATQSVALSADGRWLAANPKGNLEIWDTKTWTRATPSPSTGQFVWWFGFAASQAPLADLSAVGLRWWQVGAGAEARSGWGATFAAALSPDGKILATAAPRQPSASTYDRPNVSIWDAATGRLLQTFVAHEVGVSIVAFSPDGKWLATAGQESRIDPRNVGGSLAAMQHSIKIWDAATWQLRGSLPFVGMGGGLGRFSPDGRVLAVTMPNGVTLYDVPEGRAIRALSGGGHGAVRFSPDGQWLAQGSGAGIALWNLAALVK
jgi:WD40 repeat protein